ncbi:vacuolar membrane protein-domain-containing protein [Gymnopilus junonius]|uniref:Vacuolar membrane protein-domain-containing protein n=1 Tax=Gymnopilus junonius TaxID=109634 RepID=A0A9P5NZ93_GYMJU|nr:vacuolar membrane protein-domain-containing protein [Gymnopilus junonius]
MPLFDDLPGEYPDVDQPSCQLLGRTALVVQGLMGMLVILSLVYKRHRESLKRPWRIWLFDVSKQVVGQLFVHGVNLLASDLVSNHTSSKNACVSYFLNILIDTTFGVAMIYVTLHALTRLFTDKFMLKGFESGMYGDPPSLIYWARQAALYVLTLTTMKAVVITILILFPGIYLLGEWLLSWTWTGEGDAVQVIFVMGIFPITMNIVQFWLIDSIVKASTTGPLTLDVEQGTYEDHEPIFHAPENDDDHGHGADVSDSRRFRNSISSLDSRGLHSQDDLSFATEDATKVSTPNPKSSASSSKHVIESHEYPPSLSSSFSSNASYPNKVPREAKNLLKKTKRREPSTPTHIRVAREGSSRNSSMAPASIPRTPSPPTAAAVVVPQDRAEWADPWDDSNDWDKETHHKQHALTTTGEWNSSLQTAS